MKLLRNIYKKLKLETKASLDDFVSLILGVAFMCFFVIPPLTEFLCMFLQAREVETLAKAAAQRACSLLPDNLSSEGNASRLGEMGIFFRASEVFPLMNNAAVSVFEEQAKNISKYAVDPYSAYSRNSNPLNMSLTIVDPMGNILMKNGVQQYSQYGGYVGTSGSRHVCPAPPDPSWEHNWCIPGSAHYSVENVKNAFKGNVRENLSDESTDAESDASYRMMALQAGRCHMGSSESACLESARNSLKGKIHKCIVSITKRREYVFNGFGFHGGKNLLGCPKGSTDAVLLPCSIGKRGEAVFRASTSSWRESNAYGIRSGSFQLIDKLFGNYKSYEQKDSLVYDTETKKKVNNQIWGVDQNQANNYDKAYRLHEEDQQRNSLRDRNSDVSSNFFIDDPVIDKPVEIKTQ